MYVDPRWINAFFAMKYFGSAGVFFSHWRGGECAMWVVVVEGATGRTGAGGLEPMSAQELKIRDPCSH